MVLNDSYVDIPAGCVWSDAGMTCAVPGLQPGRQLAYSFVLTEMWSPTGADDVYAIDSYTDAHGAEQSNQARQQVTVIEGSSPPSSPGSPPASAPPGSPSSTPGASSSGPTPPGSGAPTAQPSA